MVFFDWLWRAARSFKVAGQFQSGRQAFLVKRYKDALVFFAEAARLDPDYVFEAEGFRESLWTYLGRTQYGAEKFGDARASFERAVLAHSDDHLGRLFLGLTYIRLGDRANGVRAVEPALKGLHQWLELSIGLRSFDALWDPQGEIRAAIESLLAMISRHNNRQAQVPYGVLQLKS